ncbi:zinc finger CCHC domain-containing protein 8 isoform X2 [Electrophorus electricus]|uniref:zinc finger CCHC domain-containing protein 8 isoform X2 n=1 Tax=Electrophorus electricus TaxID=8005 RepID=UPI0015D07EC2|nr:zinc finger CCHC domain-containing protein 8 isoform X2 [Electrophorus electricus]
MEVEFGDRELFEQLEEDTPVAKHIRFTDDEEAPDDRELREKLEECDETIGQLKAENEELRRKLNFLSRPTGVNVVNSKIDGPLCQILFGNNRISKEYRQEIEDFIYGLIQKHQHQQNNDKEGSALHVSPQNSSFVMEENHKTNDCSTAKQIKDAFSIVGSVLYFTSFCLDKLGQPLLNDNPQLTEGWEVPKYPQVFGQVIALEGQEMQIKEKRPKPCCFNCEAEDHQLRDCPKPKDMARISEKRKQFTQGSNQCNQRYHAEEVEERFAKYKPGIVSKELLDALGVVANTLPPFIYRMRELGYPPGWLKEAEMENSGLMLYDASGDDEEDMNGRNQNISYDVSKLVDFPGFNVSAPSNIRDDYRAFGSIPMQPQHWKHTFATQLSNMYPAPVSKINKRCHESESTPQQTKKQRPNSDVYGSSDMDTDSDQDAAGRARSEGFRFQPPLPPGSPLISTPPPLPLGTPPVTPTPPPLPKGTPPLTPPTNSSPIPQSKCGAGGEESEDGLTLEELEEQQRLLWAALESADNANSDSETGASGTPGRGSPPMSPSARPDTEMDEDMEAVKMEQISSLNSEVPSTPTSPVKEQVTEVYEDEISDDNVKDALVEDLSNMGAESYDELIVLDEISQKNDYDAEKHGLSEVTEGMSTQVLERDSQEENEEPTTPKVMAVPHRSKFAEGIIPFEDTPEFTEVAEATGVYLRIRDLLKGSPRNQLKNKK